MAGGRPKIEVDEKLLESLALIHLSDRAIANILGISIDTLHRRYADLVDECRSKSEAKLANIIWDLALNLKEEWALKTLSSHVLGYGKKQVEVDLKGQMASTNINLNEEKVREILDQLEEEV